MCLQGQNFKNAVMFCNVEILQMESYFVMLKTAIFTNVVKFRNVKKMQFLQMQSFFAMVKTAIFTNAA